MRSTAHAQNSYAGRLGNGKKPKGDVPRTTGSLVAKATAAAAAAHDNDPLSGARRRWSRDTYARVLLDRGTNPARSGILRLTEATNDKFHNYGKLIKNKYLIFK